MLSKNQVKRINALATKKGREEAYCFVAEGVKVVEELLAGGFIVKEIYGLKDVGIGIKDLGLTYLTEMELKKISGLSTPQKIVAVFEIPEFKLDVNSLKDKLTLVLDNIQDPGNLGTIIRIADWFGISDIICSIDTVDCYNPKVVQATMGSLARVKVHYTDLVRLMSDVRGEMGNGKIYGAVLGGENIYTSKLTSSGFIVMGNEANGISEKIMKHITHKISIPSFSDQKNNATGKMGAESLNVGVATAIICSEFKR